MMPFDNLIIVSESFDKGNRSISYDSEELMLAPKHQLREIKDAFRQFFSEVTVISDAASFVNIAPTLTNCIVFPYSYGRGSDINRVAHVTSVCETLKIPYIGADSYTRVICRDKWLSKKLVSEFELDTARSVIIRNSQDLDKVIKLKSPMIVKPNSQSNSRFIDGKSVIDRIEQAADRIEDILAIGDSVLVEEFIDAEEYSICYLGSKKSLKFRQIIRRVPSLSKRKEKYRYVPLDHRTNQVSGYLSTQTIATVLPTKILEKSDKLFHALTKCNYLRIDGRFDGKKFQVLELTPDAGIAPTHSISMAAKFAGYPYVEFINQLIQSSVEDL